MRTTFFAAALSLAALPATVPALAVERSDEVMSLDVPYSDLNLASPAGAKVMLRRIKQAASTVCGGKPDARMMREHRHYRDCVRTAMEGALRQLNAPLVTALYRGAPIDDPRLAVNR